jgi:hypothetical protein
MHAFSPFPPPCKRGRGTIGWWRGRGLQRNSGGENEASSQTPPPPPYARVARFGRSPSPAIAGGGKNKLSFSRRVCCSRPSHASQSKQKLTSETDLRQINPVAGAEFITVDSEHVARMERKRNPGTIEKLQSRPRISLRSIRATKKETKKRKRKRNAVRRCSVTTAALRAAARILVRGCARLPAFHRGSRPRDSCIPRLSFGPGFAGQAPKIGRELPPGAGPGYSEHLARRS